MNAMFHKGLRIGFAALLALFVSFLVCAVMLFFQGINPLDVFASILYGAAGNLPSILSSISVAVPLAIAALGVVVAWRAGVYNIGIEGQLFVGGLFSAYVGTQFDFLPFAIHMPLSVLAGAVGGMVWALLPAIMKVKMNFNEVITTVLMNYLGIYFVSYAVSGPLKPEGVFVNQSDLILESAILPRFSAQYEINAGIILLLIGLVLVTVMMNKSIWGYQLRAVGLNPRAAYAFGMSSKKVAIWSFLISGAFAGIAGSVEVLGNQGVLAENFAVNFGYNAIAVALLGGITAPGAFFAALFMGGLRNGGIMMQIQMGVSATMLSVIQAIIIITVLVFTTLQANPEFLRRKKKENSHHA